MNPILYIVINKELNMSAGKAAAQAVHAAMMLEGNTGKFFASHLRRTVIILEAENTDQIRNLHEYLLGTDLYSAYYIDEGANEVSPYAITALAVEPFDADDEEKRAIFAPFNLFQIVDDDDYPAEGDDWKGKARTELYTELNNYARLYFITIPWYVRKTLKWLKKR